MLRSKNGLLLAGTNVLNVIDWSRLTQDTRVDVPIRVPESGMPLTKESVIVRPLYVNKPVMLKGTAVKQSTTLSFNSNYFDEGLVVETLGDYKKYLEYLVANGRQRVKKDAQARLDSLKARTSGMPDGTILRLFAVDKDGKCYASSTGVFASSPIALSSVVFSNGKHLDELITSYADKNGGDKVKHLAANLGIREVPTMASDIQVNDTTLRETLGLMGIILTVRGLSQTFGHADEVMAEFKLVAEPVLDRLGEAGLQAWEMPWALSSFKRLNLPDDKRLVANYVGGYLTAHIQLLSVNGTGDTLSYANVPLGTALGVGKWAFNNNTYSVRLGDDAVFTIDPKFNDIIAKAQTLTQTEISQIIKVILDAAAVYGRCLGDNDLWTTAIWLEWLGIRGFMGGLAINAS